MCWTDSLINPFCNLIEQNSNIEKKINDYFIPIYSIHFVKYMFRNCVMCAQDIIFIWHQFLNSILNLMPYYNMMSNVTELRSSAERGCSG